MTLIEQSAGRDFSAESAFMTSPGDHAALIDALPDDIGQLVRIIHGLAIYDVIASEFYDAQLSSDRQADIHIRTFAAMLDRLIALDRHPLPEPRPPERRLACRCRNFTLLLVAPLRAKGVPARARCGFAAYFNPGHYEDHWVCEYWNAIAERWQLVDPQLDDVWHARLGIDFDVFDVPRDQFLIAADAWQQCRNGVADPQRFGISFAQLYGLWFIAGSLVRDLAALNKIEMLPWDVWGVQPRPNEQLDASQLAFFDQLARFTRDPDSSFDELRKAYADSSGCASLRSSTTLCWDARSRSSTAAIEDQHQRLEC
jgi:hypothetical protein